MSTIKANQWLNSDGTENYKCRAWVNFNGTGTVAIRASGNVSSITDNGVGDYTVNFTTPMVDANYSAVSSGGENVNDNASANTMVVCKPYSSSNTRVLVYTPQLAYIDRTVVSVSIFR